MMGSHHGCKMGSSILCRGDYCTTSDTQTTEYSTKMGKKQIHPALCPCQCKRFNQAARNASGNLRLILTSVQKICRIVSGHCQRGPAMWRQLTALNWVKLQTQSKRGEIKMRLKKAYFISQESKHIMAYCIFSLNPNHDSNIEKLDGGLKISTPLLYSK